ncbi:DUF433 domain-containing protein [Leptolyngbya sp. BC1307]|uniref:DUF433 domain-containing protein n=1 Tax=Leptolyngbya sp. BC1307 TaxID=2029589 RepID=UPI000EFBFA15|nr:DUF433 domain-containing protein [Leptolyngbya sp. BC1307]
MTDQELLQRISHDSKVLAGKPVIRGTRLSVDFILNLLAHGSSFDEILDEYEGLTLTDIQACLLFASQSLASATFMPLTAESA